ncbi:MAG: cyclic peptide export ABC transporter [Candidatus Aminicenantes bacterium]|nr:cyclic peptide export ABC transporter [Candidatus Aminicenantes bacterium]
MKHKKSFLLKSCIFTGLLVFLQWGFFLCAADGRTAAEINEIEEKVTEWMAEGDIPGLSLVIANGSEVYTKSFGYADVDKKIPVTGDTMFELCSTSKAFTALTALKLEQDGLINPDAPVSRYLPWFYAVYKGKKQSITLRQLLHQTSGIPFRTISKIPASNEKNALQQTVRNIVGVELDDLPGRSYRYATINYDVIGAVIEAVTGLPYETYMKKSILDPLGLHKTGVGKDPVPGENTAAGYKIGFFKARKYQAPVYRGNTPAGYIVSNGRDMALWLKLQMGLEQNEFTPLIKKTQQRDRTVSPDKASLLSYAMGWMVSLDGSGMISHGGLNPNFSTYIRFLHEEKIGVAVLANSNSNYTPYIAQAVMSLLRGEPMPPKVNLGDNVDKGSTVFSLLLSLFLLFLAAFFVIFVIDIVKGRRKFHSPSLKTFARFGGTLLLLSPFLGAIYLLPYLLADIPWKTALVWTPASFKTAILLVLAAVACSYLNYILSSLFPHRNKYLKSLPLLIILSLLSGSANAVVIFLLTISLQGNFELVYLSFYFILAMLLYLMGRKTLQVRLVRITFDIIYDLRIKLVEKIFGTSYRKFERLDRGRVLATLNNDTAQMGQAAIIFVQVASSLITVVGAFMYLATIAFWSTIVTLVVITIVATIYSIVTQRARVLMEIARDMQDEYLGLLDGMNDGFKELSIHSAKKSEYSKDMLGICERFRDASANAMVKFVNAFMVGESMLIVVLGAVGLGIPVIFPNIPKAVLMSFIMVLLYLIGPVTGILNAIPGAVQVRVAWNRVQQLIKEIPANIPPSEMEKVIREVPEVNSIKAQGVFFEYETKEENEKFTVGPIDFTARKGEIVFIIGGNGSGKTTLAKLLTGLYIPEKGSVTIDGKETGNYSLGEYFSVVFGDFHLFEKLYDVDLSGKEQVLKNYLDMLRLQGKVKVEGNAFSTIDLSGGQRKRLALLRCYLEDRPIYLFDEVAADQDPEFRKFFYRELLIKMKEQGKIVIAITHDDHYFDVADRVVKMDMGKIELVEAGAGLSVTR